VIVRPVGELAAARGTPLYAGDRLETRGGYLRFEATARAAGPPAMIFVGPGSVLGLGVGDDGVLVLSLASGELRLLARGDRAHLVLRAPALSCTTSGPHDVAVRHGHSTQLRDIAPAAVFVSAREGRLDCAPLSRDTRVVPAGETLEVVRDYGTVYGPRRLGPLVWESSVLRATALDDVEGLRLSGLGSDRERIEAAFRHRFRDRDCELRDVRVWTTTGGARLTLGEVDFTCGDGVPESKRLKKDSDGWGWLS